jgi:Peptidase family M41.
VGSGLSSLGIVKRDQLPDEQLFNECREIIAELEKSTLSLLLDNKEALMNLADCLLTEENIDQSRFQEVIAI